MTHTSNKRVKAPRTTSIDVEGKFYDSALAGQFIRMWRMHEQSAETVQG